MQLHHGEDSSSVNKKYKTILKGRNFTEEELTELKEIIKEGLLPIEQAVNLAYLKAKSLITLLSTTNVT